LAGPDNLILEANPAMARLLELAGSDALIGQDPFANTPLDEPPWLRESLANLSPDGAASIISLGAVADINIPSRDAAKV